MITKIIIGISIIVLFWWIFGGMFSPSTIPSDFDPDPDSNQETPYGY